MSYKCEICGKTYDTVSGRAACEARCLKEQKEANEKMLAQREQQEKEDARKEIDASIDATTKLLKKYKERFGEEAPIALHYKKETDFESVWPSLFNKLFW